MFNDLTSSISEPEARKKTQKVAQLVEISAILNSTLKPDILLKNILDTAADLLECSGVSILLYDEREKELRFAATTTGDIEKLEQIPVPLDNSLAGTIFTENRHLVINSTRDDPRHYNEVGDEVGLQIDSLLGVPMRIKDRVTGVIEALNKNEGEFSDFDVSLLLVVASQAAISIHNARLIQALQKANIELSQADKLKRDLMSVASHELRTPLGNILGYATLLHEDAIEENKPLAESILKASSKLRAVLDDIANMNLLYTGKADLDFTDTSLQRVINYAQEEVRMTVNKEDHTVDYQIPEVPIQLCIDLPKMSVVFVNLLLNAIQFTPVEGEIRLTIDDRDDEVMVSIVDSGRGISPENLEKIFEVFYQVDDHMTRRYGGLGLGLSIARELVNLHGGRIWAESEGLGEGSTFRVVLPKSAD
ncbi:MAG: GAF domain-containing sensor histidine kinase [Anaerolineales bacterium]|nr:GAF domain-containing sensor histidine kinase [Anaerolineales bacterium]